jgi:isochorismate synthase
MQSKLFSHLIEWLQNEKTFVCYQLPQSNQIICLLQQNSKVYFHSDWQQNGFVMAPFDNNQKSVFIPVSESQRFTFHREECPQQTHDSKKISFSQSERNSHLKLVEKSINFIKSGQAQKVVISRKQLLPMTSVEKTAQLFLQLISHYQEAMVYFWHHPAVGIWMGASPERLVTTHGKHFETMALAGTQRYQESINWTEKEKIEQQLVTDYITHQLQPITLQIEISETFTKKAGPLAHLCTQINGHLKDNFSIKNLVKQLHPTPAVCGTPKEKAFDFIINNEGYQREFYTGYLGVVDTISTELFVNLRCLSIHNNHATLYIGGGITAESNPVREWEETMEKAEVLGKFIH